MSGAMARANEAAALPGLVQALLDFERAPGRYAVALREPRALFDATHAVMLLAAGRPVEGLPPLMPGQHTGAVQQAARFFVRTVLLRPGADHYSLLGLATRFEPETLRDHYRLMIRLTHPDFAASGEPWPADAASRINIANDVLGSVVKRAEYDTSQKRAASALPLSNPLMNPLAVATSQPAPTPSVHRTPAAQAGEASARRAWRARKIALAAVGAIVCAGLLWLMTPGGNEGSLVAKRGQPAPSAETMAANEGSASTRAPAEPAGDGSALAQAQPRLAERAEDTTNTVNANAAPPSAAAPTVPKLARAAQARAPQTVSQPARATPVKTAKAAVRPAPTAATETAIPKAPVIATPNGGAANDESETRLELGLDTHPTSLTLKSPTTTAPTPADVESGLTMAQVQPQLAQVLSGLKSGKGENVVRWLDGNWREHPAANAFVSNYQSAIAGQSVVQLGKVQLRSRSLDQQFVVDGVVELYLQGSNAEPHIKELQMSAHFLPRDGNGQPMLTQVVLKHP